MVLQSNPGSVCCLREFTKEINASIIFDLPQYALESLELAYDLARKFISMSLLDDLFNESIRRRECDKHNDKSYEEKGKEAENDCCSGVRDEY